MEKYQVIIIGAGPAGLACAQILAQAGKQVLVLEKNEKVGPKICAGGLSFKCLKLLNLPGELLERQFNQMNIFIDGQEIKVARQYPLVSTISREKLGQWMLKKAKAAGARIRIQVLVKEIKDNCLIVNQEEKIAFDYLVGADGSHSLVRRWLGIETERQPVGSGIEYKVPGRFENLEIHFNHRFLGEDYVFIYPHRDYAFVGIATPLNQIAGAKKRLADWLKLRRIEVKETELKGFPGNYHYQGYQFGNIYLAGDAAGFIPELTGEGIYPAVVSGQEVARKIIDSQYSCPGIAYLLKIKRTHQKTRRFLKFGLIRAVLYKVAPLLLKNNFFQRKGIEKFG